MATALPRTGTVPSAPDATCDTSDMRVVHGLLRALFLDASGLVRTIGATQPRRRAAISAHIAFVSTVLAGHHHVEDALLWDDLARRAPRCGLHVGLMRSQHAEMHDLLAALDLSIAAWDLRGGPDDGTVSSHLDSIRTALERHLGDEERWILPVAATTLTQKEWNRLAEMGGEHTPKGKAFILLGYMLRSIPDNDREPWAKANLPLLLRALWRIAGRRTFDAYRRGLAVDA